MAEATVSQVKGCRWVSVWYRALMLTTDVTCPPAVFDVHPEVRYHISSPCDASKSNLDNAVKRKGKQNMESNFVISVLLCAIT